MEMGRQAGAVPSFVLPCSYLVDTSAQRVAQHLYHAGLKLEFASPRHMNRQKKSC